MTIHIIGAGLGRTGTTSLKVALEELGYQPCYHMIEAFKHPRHAQTWRAAARGDAVDWPKLFGHYQATVDFPGCTYYKELMATYPAAKVILSLRDPERWYESTYETIYQMPQVIPAWVRKLSPWVNQIYQMTFDVVWDGQFGGQFGDRARTIAAFNRWNEEVIATVPAEKLLIYEVKQGWEPLCAFLGVSMPTTPFPRKNDRRQMQRVLRFWRTIKRWSPAASHAK